MTTYRKITFNTDFMGVARQYQQALLVLDNNSISKAFESNFTNNPEEFINFEEISKQDLQFSDIENLDDFIKYRSKAYEIVENKEIKSKDMLMILALNKK